MKGFLQILRENFTENFLSIVKFTTLQIFLSLIAYLDFKIYQVDIVATYLQKYLDKKICSKKSSILVLKNMIRDCRKLYIVWSKLNNNERTNILTKLKFMYLFADDYLYIKQNGNIILVLVYVNDMIVSNLNSYHIISSKTLLDKDFELTDLGKLKYVLDILITWSYTNCLIYLSQSMYIY